MIDISEQRTRGVPGGTRKVSWDAVRVLCMFLVIAFHATSSAVYLEPQLQQRRYEFGIQVGASSLLMISAFFAAHTLARADPLVFWWGRVVRLMIPFAVAVVCTWSVVRLVAPSDWFRPSVVDLVGNLAMVWTVSPHHIQFVDGSYWTLPIQLLAFTAAAALVLLRWGRGTRLRLVLWAIVLVPLAQYPVRSSEPPEAYRALVDTLGFHRAHLFALGVGLWLWSRQALGPLHTIALGLTCLSAHYVHTLGDAPATLAMAVIVAVVAVTARGSDWGRALPGGGRRAIRWLAGISYGVYLVHQTVGYLVMRWVHDHGGGQVEEVLAMVLAALFLGWLLTRAVERPTARLVRRVPSFLSDVRRQVRRPAIEIASKPTARGSAHG